ncbi:Fic family protein [Lentzea pudingi]|uniref:Fic family protein n=2 Tax=Lentzea pudingi TaxID=1789439 RepID=A0ABQ2IPM0_9PSEU|nr:Fic family protein [Lentzea pudingi]
MKRPMPPPDFREIGNKIQEESAERFTELLVRSLTMRGTADPYLPWDKLRYKTPPDGLSHEEWWFIVRFSRNNVQRALNLTDVHGTKFSYALPDQILRAMEEITRDASGQITISEQVTNPVTRDRFLVSSLMEEAITSSQLEGASTTRKVAKEMLRTGRAPRTRDEKMILNNYVAMRHIGEIRNEKLTPELICEIHRMVTDDTMENPDASGRFQLDDEERVGVYDFENNLLHTPPPASELPERVGRLCEFANGQTDGAYIPPILRAITVHFMLSYEHPFEDGNGRTARALFYWSMLNQGYWLTEFLAISKILKAAPAKYARSFLYTEQDHNDLTYFYIYQLEVIQRAIKELHDYLTSKMTEVRSFQRSLSMLPNQFNHRQLALLENAAKDSTTRYTALSHSRSHNVSQETARQDLLDLENRGLLRKGKVGRAHAWTPVERLTEKLHQNEATA